MRFSLAPAALLLSALSSIALAQTPSYFPISAPGVSANWTSNGLNVVKWAAAKEGILTVDMQLVRLSTDGVLPIARTIPTSWNGLNVNLQDTPEGDDYFVMLLDSGGSTIYSLSNRFSISKSASAAPGTAALASPVATVTVSGSPNPTMAFAATFAASGATRLVALNPLWGSMAVLVGTTLVAGSVLLS